MPSRLENISERLAQMPMLRALLPIVAGAVLADHITLPLWSVVVGFVLLLGVAWWLRERSVANIYLCVALLLLGVMAVELRRGELHTPPPIITEQGAVVEVAIDRVTSRRGDVVLCDGRVLTYQVGENSEPQIANFSVRVVADSSIGVQIGSRLVAQSRLQPFVEDSDNRYQAYMARRGVMGEVRLYDSKIVHHKLSDKALVRWLHDGALRRLRDLSLDGRGRAVVEAMTIGERASIDSSLREDYARSGSAHLLAVSGLHVGFVYAIINILLLLFALLRHGQLLRALPAVVAIWIYAAVAGASPSVVRAAVMFSLLQLAFALSARTQALNSLAFTACVMIVWNASLLHDVGFLLSFAAVAGIVVWGVPMSIPRFLAAQRPERRLSTRSRYRELFERALSVVWRSVAITLSASIATVPLAAYMFGVVSLWSVVVGPLMILLGMATVSVAMAWILLPIGFLEGAVSHLLGGLTYAMNGIAEWCSQSGVLIFEGYISSWLCGVCYLLFALFTLLLWSRSNNESRFRRYSSKSISSSR